MFKDTNGVIRSRKFKMDREYNHQLKNDNQTDLQTTTQNIKNWTIRTPRKTGMDSCAPGEQVVPAPLMTPVVFLVKDKSIS
jgi:hypothetical protein